MPILGCTGFPFRSDRLPSARAYCITLPVLELTRLRSSTPVPQARNPFNYNTVWVGCIPKVWGESLEREIPSVSMPLGFRPVLLTLRIQGAGFASPGFMFQGPVSLRVHVPKIVDTLALK